MSLLRSNYPLFLKPLALVAITLAATFLFTSFVQRRTPRPLPERPMAAAARSFVLWLHGLGDSGPANEPIRTFFTSPEFNHTKWSFPSAPHAPVSCNYGAVMPSWFDIYEIPVSAESPKDEKGLLGAVQNVHAMIDKEVAAGISPENIFICGFSQGGALTLASALLYPKTLGGGAVFSGWVPFNSSVIERISPDARKTPMLWSHGMADGTVLFGAGQAGPPFLERAGMSCEFKLLLLLAEITAKVPAIIIFGDSSVDAGNNNYIPTIARSNFKPYGRDFISGQPTGRFCNGRLATDFISEAFGLPPTVPAYLDPTYGIEDFAAGVCFASAGSGYDNATSDVLSVIPLWKELEYFKEFYGKLKAYQGETKAQDTLSEALYIISLGTNDFLENYYTVPGGRRSQYTVEEYQDFLIGIAEGFVREIYQFGARKVDVAGILPMGCLPLERVTSPMMGSCNEMYNKVAWDFNSKLRCSIEKLNRELHGITIVYGDVYQLFVDVVQKPSTYGFEDAASGCCATGIFEMGYTCNMQSIFTCQDANKFVFWDAFHPTERMNRIVADQLMNTTLAIFK